MYVNRLFACVCSLCMGITCVYVLVKCIVIRFVLAQSFFGCSLVIDLLDCMSFVGFWGIQGILGVSIPTEPLSGKMIPFGVVDCFSVPSKTHKHHLVAVGRLAHPNKTQRKP